MAPQRWPPKLIKLLKNQRNMLINSPGTLSVTPFWKCHHLCINMGIQYMSQGMSCVTSHITCHTSHIKSLENSPVKICKNYIFLHFIQTTITSPFYLQDNFCWCLSSTIFHWLSKYAFGSRYMCLKMFKKWM